MNFITNDQPGSTPIASRQHCPLDQMPVFASIGDLLVPCIPGLYSNRPHPRVEADIVLLAWQRVQVLAGLAVMRSTAQGTNTSFQNMPEAPIQGD